MLNDFKPGGTLVLLVAWCQQQSQPIWYITNWIIVIKDTKCQFAFSSTKLFFLINRIKNSVNCLSLAQLIDCELGHILMTMCEYFFSISVICSWLPTPTSYVSTAFCVLFCVTSSCKCRSSSLPRRVFLSERLLSRALPLMSRRKSPKML